MKKILSLLLISSLFLLGGCGSEKEKSKESNIKVGIALSTGGLGDKSFNDSAYRGLERAKKELGINFKYVEPASPAEDEQYLREYAEAGYDLIIATGFQMRSAAEKVAKDYPNIKFAMIDDKVDLPNVRSLLFKEHEGSFLAGAAAAQASKTGVVGFVGGIEVPLIQKFQRGFEQGARYVNPDIRVISIYVGGQNPFNDPVKGKEMALNLIKQGVDVIYQAAGATGIGVIDAATETKTLAIGVDSDQDDVAPGVVLTSMVKNVDIAVFDTVKSVLKDEFKGGVYEFGIKDDGLRLTDFRHTKERIGEENLKKLEEIKNKIVSGEIIVTP